MVASKFRCVLVFNEWFDADLECRLRLVELDIKVTRRIPEHMNDVAGAGAIDQCGTLAGAEGHVLCGLQAYLTACGITTQRS